MQEGLELDLTTTPKAKLSACSKMKTLIEKNRLQINSNNLISELKAFVAKEGRFQARTGFNDDLVMSMILSIRMCLALKQYEVRIDEALSDTFDYDEDFIAPMPTLII